LVSESQHAAHDHAPPEAPLFGSGLATVYDALDRLVTAHDLDDAAVVVDVAPLGRQVLRAGRKPLRDDAHGLLERAPGLYVEPADAADDPVVAVLMVALTELALRHDVARLATEEA
jgi:hypothetical protein